MNFKPLHDRVIVKVVHIEEKTKTGLIIAATDDRLADTVYGQVIAAGPGKAYDSGGIVPTTVKPGDIVIFKPNTGMKHFYLNEEFFVTRESEIASIIEGVELSEFGQIDAKNLRNDGLKELESLL